MWHPKPKHADARLMVLKTENWNYTGKKQAVVRGQGRQPVTVFWTTGIESKWPAELLSFECSRFTLAFPEPDEITISPCLAVCTKFYSIWQVFSTASGPQYAGTYAETTNELHVPQQQRLTLHEPLSFTEYSRLSTKIRSSKVTPALSSSDAKAIKTRSSSLMILRKKQIKTHGWTGWGCQPNYRPGVSKMSVLRYNAYPPQQSPVYEINKPIVQNVSYWILVQQPSRLKKSISRRGRIRLKLNSSWRRMQRKK